MAALGKIRSRGAILIGVIGLALFGFIAGDMFRGCETTQREKSQRAGEVLGEKINAQDYQVYETGYVECLKMDGAQASDEQMRNQAWQDFLNEKFFAHEAEELGITVTEEEMQNVMKQGIHPLLTSMPINDFKNEQTGRFDFNKYQQFVNNYEQLKQTNPQGAQQMEAAYKYILFKERQLRNTLLMEKYQGLLAACVISNPIEAKFQYEAEKKESDVELAYFDYKSINDNDVKVTDQEMKAKYEEMKEVFPLPQEMRAVKFISVKKEATEADRKAILDNLAQVVNDLKADSLGVDMVVRRSQSTSNYLGVPLSKRAFNNDIAAQIDSMPVGAVVGPIESKLDNTYNVIKLLSKTQLPDSIQYRAIAAPGKSLDESKTTADSILTALRGGANFDELAKKYQQTAEKAWMTGASYERATNMNTDNVDFIKTLYNTGVNELQVLKQTNGYAVLQVLDKKAVTTKYDVAIVKRPIDYSPETSRSISDKLNQFVAANPSVDTWEKNAADPKYNYQVRELNNITTSGGGLPGVANSNKVLKWLFDAKVGDVSEVETCGNSNDELVVAALTNIYPKGYATLDIPQVEQMVREELLKDKKAEKLMADKKLADVKSMDAAKKQGAKVTELNQVTFAAPANVAELGVMEPALSGAIAATAKGKFSAKPVKGEAAIYFFNVKDQRMLEGKYDEKEYKTRSAQITMQRLFRTIQNDIHMHSNITDNRFMFH